MSVNDTKFSFSEQIGTYCRNGYNHASCNEIGKTLYRD